MLAYCKLLLKDRLLAFQPQNLQRAGWSKAKGLFAFVGFALLFVFLYAMVVALEYFIFQGFVALGNPEGIFAVTFLFTVAITLFVSFFYVFSTLFFSRDIEMVSALPISSRGILAAKFGLILLGEAGIALLTCLPAMILYGIHVKAGLWFYAKVLWFVPFMPVIPIAFVALLSFFLIRVSALWKRREGITTIATFLFVMAIIVGQMSLSFYMQQQGSEKAVLQFLLRQLSVVDIMARFFPPLRWMCDIFLLPGVGGWLVGLGLWAVSFAVIGLFLFFLGGSYQALAVKQGETRAFLNAQRRKGKRDQPLRPPLWALYLRELKEVFTVPAYVGNCVSTLIIYPLMVVVAILSSQQHLEGMSLMNVLLGAIPRVVYLAIAAGLICLTCCMNIAVSTSVSREGKRHYFGRIIPVAASTQLSAKLLMGFTLNLITALTTAIVLWVFMPVFWIETLVAFFIGNLFSLFVCVFGLIMDALRPRFDWKSETEAVKRNTNGMISMFGSMLGLGLLAAAFLGLSSLGLSAAWTLGAIVLALVVVDGILLWWLKSGVATTYSLQEKFN